MSSDSGDGGGAELPDEQADALLDQLAERADERDDIDLRPGSKRAVSRRSLLGAVGAAGVGALAIGSGNAEAQTGQWSNATGTAGTQDKPLTDLWAQKTHSQSISTDELWSEDTILEIGRDGALLSRRSLTSGSAPIQSAIDALAAENGGTVVLPVGLIEHPGPIQIRSHVNLVGHSRGPGTTPNEFGTQIRITNDDSEPAIDLGTHDPDNFRINGLELYGGLNNGEDPSPTTAITASPGSGFPIAWSFDNLFVNQWRGSVVDFSESYQLSGGTLGIGTSVDAGNQIAVLLLNGGPDNTIREIYCYAGASANPTANDNDLFNVGASSSVFRVGSINIGGAAGGVVTQGGVREWELYLGSVNYEPNSSNSTTNDLFTPHTSSRFVVGGLRVNGGGGAVDVDHAYQINEAGAGNIDLPKPSYVFGGGLNDVEIQINNDLAGLVDYGGEIDDIRNGSGAALSYPIQTGDGYYKTSTGIGYTSGTDRLAQTE